MELGSYYKIYENLTAEQFIFESLKFGKPVFTSLIGVFDTKGLGHRREMELDYHKDGDYSPEITAEYNIDYVSMYCLRDGEVTTMFKFDDGSSAEFVLKKGQAIIFDNQRCKHARKGKVGDRLLLRLWIEKEKK